MVRVPRSFIPRKKKIREKTVDLSTEICNFFGWNKKILEIWRKEPNLAVTGRRKMKDKEKGQVEKKVESDQNHVTYFTIGEEETNSFDAHLQETTFSSS